MSNNLSWLVRIYHILSHLFLVGWAIWWLWVLWSSTEIRTTSRETAWRFSSRWTWKIICIIILSPKSLAMNLFTSCKSWVSSESTWTWATSSFLLCLIFDEINFRFAWSKWWLCFRRCEALFFWFLNQHINESFFWVLCLCSSSLLLIWRSWRSLNEDNLVMFTWSSSKNLLTCNFSFILWWWNMNVASFGKENEICELKMRRKFIKLTCASGW